MSQAEFESRRFAFEVGGEEVIGVLRVPKGAQGAPALVFDGPLTSVKEQVAGNYADALAARGFVTLAFDHRHFGESGGQPRQYEHPGRKLEDVRAAVAALAELPEVDGERIGAVGVCAGALAPAFARAFFAALGGPKQEAWVESEGQVDFYDKLERIEPAADRLAEHFRASLG